MRHTLTLIWFVLLFVFREHLDRFYIVHDSSYHLLGSLSGEFGIRIDRSPTDFDIHNLKKPWTLYLLTKKTSRYKLINSLKWTNNHINTFRYAEYEYGVRIDPLHKDLYTCILYYFINIVLHYYLLLLLLL